MEILEDELPDTAVVIVSLSSPDLADGWTHGRIDLAFLRHERNAPGIVFTRLAEEPLVVLMAADHPLAARAAISAGEIAGERLVGVSHDKSPALRSVVDAYGARLGIDLAPAHHVDNLSMAMSMAMSMVASMRGIALMPRYARNLLPTTVVCRPLAGEAPTIDLSVGHRDGAKSPRLSAIVSRIGHLKFTPKP